MKYPVKRVNFSKDNWDHRKIRGMVAFMCPHCLGLTYLKGGLTINLQNEAGNPIHAEIKYQVTCNECGEYYETTEEPLDPNIAPVIMMLNRKGYETVACCEGHKYPAGMNVGACQFYIKFKEFKYYKLTEKYLLPGLVCLDDDDIKNEEFIIRGAVNTMSKHAPSPYDLCDSIRGWIRRLPSAAEADEELAHWDDEQ